MADGFLGYKTSLMLDVVVCALLLVVPVLAYSIYLVKVRRGYMWHRNLQAGLGVVLLLAVGAFEIDMQLVHGGWENIVVKARGEEWLATPAFSAVRTSLWIHLIFAVTTPILWATTLILAWRRYGNPPLPGPHSPLHKRLGWLSAIDIGLTSITGLWFYYLAFVQ